jgi:hypothetical protein
MKLEEIDRLIVKRGTVKIGRPPALTAKELDERVAEVNARGRRGELDQEAVSKELERLRRLAQDNRGNFEIRLLTDAESEALLVRQWPAVSKDDPGRGDPDHDPRDRELLLAAVSRRYQVVRAASVGIALGIEVEARGLDWLKARGIADRTAGDAGAWSSDRSKEWVGRFADEIREVLTMAQIAELDQAIDALALTSIDASEIIGGLGGKAGRS